MAPAGVVCGAQIGRYALLEELGRGGMGVVYKAYDPDLDRAVALKLIKTSGKTDANLERRSARMLREAQALAQLNHPNVVSVHDVGMLDGDVFVAMELAEGRVLSDWVRFCAPSRLQALDVMLAAGKGLRAAHQAGLVHRDFKPQNVIVGTDGTVRVIDFGLARTECSSDTSRCSTSQDLQASDSTPVAEGASSRAISGEDYSSSSSKRLLDATLTRDGTVVGTPMYMAPEQTKSAVVDARADQYSFCVVLCEMLYSAKPFTSGSLRILRQELAHGKVPPPHPDLHVPQWIQHIIARGLASNPDDRFSSMDELLRQLQHDPEKAAKQRGKAVRRQVGLIGLAVLSLVLPGAVWYEFAVRRSGLCKSGTVYVAQFWNAQTKSKLHGAMLSTGVPYATHTAQRVQGELDTYAAEWEQMFAESCRATRVGGQQSVAVMDLRTACLHERLREMRSLVEVLVDADVRVVRNAVQAVAGLAAINGCADVAALRAPKERIQPPKSDTQAKKAELIRKQLTDAKVLQVTGKYAEGMQLAERSLTEAKVVAHLPLEAEAYFRLGMLTKSVGKYDKAAELLKHAYRSASAAFHVRVAALASAELSIIVGYNLAKYDEGLGWSRLAEAMEHSPAVTYEARALRHGGRADVYFAQGDNNTAMEHYRKVLAIWKSELGPDSPRVGSALNNIAGVLFVRGELEHSIEHYRQALAIFEDALGPSHPKIAIMLLNIGNVAMAQSMFDSAWDHFKKAHTLVVDSMGREHPLVSNCLIGQSEILLARGRFVESLGHIERAKSLIEKTLGPRHPQIADCLSLKGNIYRVQSKYDAARAAYGQALAIWQEIYGHENTQVARCSVGLGDVFKDEADDAAALSHYERALPILEKNLGREHQSVADGLASLGVVLFRQNVVARAQWAFERVVRICTAKVCSMKADGYGFFGLARTSLLTGEPVGDPYQMAQRARDALSRAPALFLNELAEISDWLLEYNSATSPRQESNAASGERR